jgi:hypothetical protein
MVWRLLTGNPVADAATRFGTLYIEAPIESTKWAAGIMCANQTLPFNRQGFPVGIYNGDLDVYGAGSGILVSDGGLGLNPGAGGYAYYRWNAVADEAMGAYLQIGTAQMNMTPSGGTPGVAAGYDWAAFAGYGLCRSNIMSLYHPQTGLYLSEMDSRDRYDGPGACGDASYASIQIGVAPPSGGGGGGG